MPGVFEHIGRQCTIIIVIIAMIVIIAIIVLIVLAESPHLAHMAGSHDQCPPGDFGSSLLILPLPIFLLIKSLLLLCYTLQPGVTARF